MNDVLVISCEEDPHADEVIEQLDERNASHFRLNTDQLLDYDITYDIGSFTISDGSQTIEPDESWSIWNRRMVDPSLPDMHPDMAEVAYTESEKTLEGLINSHPGKVVNRRADNKEASNKIHQYEVLNDWFPDLLPKTRITNDPEEVQDFYDEQRPICFKQQKMTMADGLGGKIAYTNKVTDKHLKNKQTIRNNPCYFQEYVDKDHELRVTVVGDNVFPVRIDSQKSDISKVDFRRYDFDNVTHEYTSVPKEIEQLCKDITHHFDLRYSSIDLLKKDNEYTYLEMNPNGQYLWTELLTEAPISEALSYELT